MHESGQTSALTLQDDPLGRAAKIAHMWKVEHHIVAGIQRENGTIARANPLVIRRGDFVDVAVNVQVVTMRARRLRKTEILLCPLEVVRLASAAQVTVSTSTESSVYCNPHLIPPSSDSCGPRLWAQL